MLLTSVSVKCSSPIRCHHLLKTFWGGRCGWRDEQLPDGTVLWTDPHGQTHLTRPGSYPLFPQLCRPTAPVVLSTAERAAAAAAQAQPGPGLAMPRRRRTRAQDRAARAQAERRRNQTRPQTNGVTCPPVPPRAPSFADWLATLPPGDHTPPPF
jgi:hypothetical protein